MSTLKHALKNLTRHRKKACILLLLSCSLSVALALFAGNILQNEKELNSLVEETQLRLQIVSTNGTMKDGLLINDGFLANVEAIDGVERGLLTAVGLFNPIHNGKKRETHYVGAATNASPLREGQDEDNITYLSGYGDELFEGSEPVCLLSEKFLAEMKLSLGDTISCELSTSRDDKVFSAGNSEFTVVGTYRDTGNSLSGATMVCSYDALKEKFAQANLHIWPTSAWFQITSPQKLNEVKSVLTENNIDSVQPRANIFSNRGYAAVINDRLYILRAEPLERQINLLRSLYPLFFAAVALIAFLACVLLAQSRRGEIAVCRSLGESRGSVFFQFFLENALVSLAGVLLGFGGAALFSSVNGAALLFPFVGCLGACYLGIAAAVLLLNRTNVIAILTSLD